MLFLKERQRLETILNLCAEYNKCENSSPDSLSASRMDFPGVAGDILVWSALADNVLDAAPSTAGALHFLQKQRKSQKENLKGACSTKSAHQEVRVHPASGMASCSWQDRQVRKNTH